MIGFLKGVLFEKTPEHILLVVNNVGYEVEVPASSLCLLPKINEETSLYIYTHVREDAIRLFGFSSYFDKLVFESLLQVSGIGPKAALALLGVVDGYELCEFVTKGQVARLTSIPGIGAKTADRLVLELKNKMQKLMSRYEGERRPSGEVVTLFDDKVTNSKGTKNGKANVLWKQIIEDLKSALSNLGYKDKQFSPVIEHFAQRLQEGEELTFELALKQSLKKLSDHALKN